MLYAAILFPDSKVHGANMGTTWVLSAPDGPHVGPMNLALRVDIPDKSSRPSDVYMREQTEPFLVQIMARRLIGAKPLLKVIRRYCQ